MLPPRCVELGNAMTPTLPNPLGARHLERLEIGRPVMAKADLKNLEPWKVALGRAIQRTFALAGVSQKEAAALIARDQAQIARWIAGSERPQMDAIFAVDALRQSFVVALAELAGQGVEIETVVRIRRSA